MIGRNNAAQFEFKNSIISFTIHFKRSKIMKRYFLFNAVILILLAGPLYAQKFEGLAPTPPMGWNSLAFGSSVNEALIREMANAMVSNGMMDAGYRYIVIDDCWQGLRDTLGNIRPDPLSFPSGMKALADYIHIRGLKFGIYSCAGDKTCGGYPGSRGYEVQDAHTFALWGVDYLKYDWCATTGLNSVDAYTKMRDALYAAGRPVVFSICERGDTKPWEWAKNVGHMWRTTGNITDCFDCESILNTWPHWGFMKIVEMRKNIRQYAGPDHWNDPDVLEVGKSMTLNEDRAHFSLWCMMAAPLIAGNDLRNMKKETIDILANMELIAIDQDPLGVQGFRYDAKEGIEVWVKPLEKGDWAVCFLNRATIPQEINFDWSKNIITDPVSKWMFDAGESVYSIRNLWARMDIGTTNSIFHAVIPVHDVVVLRLKKL
jgi:alpha-galactosidase